MLFKKYRKLRLAVAIGGLMVLIALLGLSCAPQHDINSRINTIVKKDVFSIAGWEAKTLIREVRLSGIKTVTEDDIATVKQYFALTAQMNALEAKRKANDALSGTNGLSLQDAGNEASLRLQKEALTPRVEAIIERQIRDTLIENGIYNPFCGKGSFPPVNFKLSTPPNLLVISPREKIERSRDIMLLPDISFEEIDSIETQVAALGVSALVVPLGGLGATFPTFVENDADLLFTVNAAIEEWLHQYLAFKPLGFNYVLDSLGIKHNPDIVTINETIASMSSEEIGAQLYEKYYGVEVNTTPPATVEKPSFDFNAAMREIRINTDNLLTKGQVTQAEQYIEEQRQFLATKGYYIRKLNQAYFAFYGSYADSPTSVDPIGTKLREIRSQATSIQDFLSQVSGITGVNELDKIQLKD
jgi:hypothetical protein